MPAPELVPVQTFTGQLPNFLTQPPAVFAQNANNSVLQWNGILESYNVSLASVNLALEYVDGQVVLAQQAVTDATSAGSEQVSLAEEQVSLAEEQVTIAQGHASDAQNSAAMAAAAANNHGDWALLSGAFPAGEAVIHDGSVWISLDAIADVATSEPGVSADWFNYSDSVEGLSNPMTTAGDIIVGASGGAPSRVAKGANNTVWGVSSAGNLGYQNSFCGYGNAILLNNTHDLNTITPPHTIRGNARFSWTGGSLPANVPPGYGNAYMDMFSMGSGHEFRRQVIYDRNSNNVIMRRSGDSGATWTEQVIGAVTEAPTDGTRNIRRNGTWETIGAITGSGITMTTGRMLGRTTAGAGAIEQLTGAQVRSFAGAAAAGRVADSGITSATARLVGRIAAGVGAVAELTAIEVLTFLGAGKYTTSTSDASYGTVTFSATKVGSMVFAQVTCTPTSSGSYVTFDAVSLISASYRPAVLASGTVMTGSSKDFVTAHVTSTGTLSLEKMFNPGGSRTVSISLSYAI